MKISIFKTTEGLFAFVFFAALVVLSILDIIVCIDFKDVLVEAHGLLFDLLIFGILLTIYEKIRKTEEDKTRYIENIDDLRGWNDKEAGFKIAGNIKRLNRIGVTEIDLHNCNLFMTDLSKVKLTNSNLSRANLSESNLSETNLKNAKLNNANLVNCLFSSTNLEHAQLDYATIDKIDWFDYFSNQIIGIEQLKATYTIVQNEKNGLYFFSPTNKI
jgi:hypothetical protein